MHAQFSTFSGNYYQSTTPSGNAVAGSTYSNISFDFIAVPPPAPIVENKGFSASYTGSFVAQYSGYYKFTTAADDGIRLSINGNSIINQWQDQPATPTTSSVFLLARASIYSYPVTLEYYENGVGPASLSLSYTELFDNAQYISTTLPTTMFAGRTYSGTITLRNTGTSTWTNNNYDIKYTLLANAYTKNLWGPNSVSESYIPDSILTLDPNLTMSFPFTLIAPKTPGSYPFQCQMMDSRHGSFGAITPLSITVLPPPPFAPTNLTATPGNGHVNLSWMAATSGTVATSYTVRYSTVYGQQSTGSAVSGLSGTSANITGLTNGTRYYFTVSGVNANGEGDPSVQAYTTPVDPPTLSATAGVNSITLNWPPVKGATSYTFTLMDAVNTTWRLLGYDVSGPSTTVTGLTPGVLYTFACYNKVDGVLSYDFSNKVSATPLGLPLAPTGLTATPGNGHVNLSWTAATSGTPATSYTVRYSTISGGESTGGVVSGFTATSANITGLTNGTPYFFTVAGVNTGVEGYSSNEATTTPVAPPTLSATAGMNSITLNWSAVVGATSYTFTLMDTVNTTWRLLGYDVSGPTTTVTGLTPGVLYTFACYNKVNGVLSYDFSNKVSATPLGITLAAQIVWTSDATTSPVTQAAATNGGKFGGYSTVHLTLTAPQNLTSATATAVRIHEVSGGSADIVYTNLNMSGIPSSVCGEQLASPPPNTTARYLDVPWGIGGHNGNYTVTATVSAVVGGVTQTVTLTSPLMVDREDLIIPTDATGNLMTTPQNPTPILWDPSNPTLPNPVPLTVKVTAAYKAGGTAYVTIYHSYDNVNRVQMLTKPFLTTDGQVSFVWDGATNVTDGNGGFLPADPGVYVFQFFLTDNLGAHDSDKSNFPFQNPAGLNVTAPTTEAVLNSDDGITVSYNVAYTISSNDTPARSGSRGQIDVYDPSLTNVYTQQLTATDTSPGTHTITLSFPSSDLGGTYTFVVSPQDQDLDKDRGGRLRYALQHNQSKSKGCAIVFTSSREGDDTFAIDRADYLSAIQALGYSRMFLGVDASLNHLDRFSYFTDAQSPTFTDVTVGTMRLALERKSPIGVKLLKVAMFAGHGSADGNSIDVRGQTGYINIRLIDLVVSHAYHISSPHFAGAAPYHADYSDNTADALELDKVAPLGTGSTSSATALSNLDLVLLVACFQGIAGVATANTNGADGALGTQFVNLGAGCVVRVGAAASYTSCEHVFLNGPPSFPAQGFLNMLKAQNMTIAAAESAALINATRYLNAQKAVNGPYNNFQILVAMEGPRSNIILKP